ETDTGHDLDHEQREGRRPEHVPPAHRSPEGRGHRMREHRADRVLELEANAEPSGYRSPDPRHGVPPPGVGRRCDLTMSLPPSTRHSRWNNGRGGGPPATVPSA